jgi:hypothetical protein
MSLKLLGVAIAAITLGGASLAQAQSYRTIDLSPFVNQSLTNGWSVDGAFTLSQIGGTTSGNQGSSTPFNVANTAAGNNFWYGTNEGVNSNSLFPSDANNPVLNSFTIAVTAPDVQSVYTLANNTFGEPGIPVFNVVFQGAGGTITDTYVGADNTKDYLTTNCSSTGCSDTPNAAAWYYDGVVVYNEVEWDLPTNFGLTSITFNQLSNPQENPNGAIVLGVTLGVPEPSTWALMIGGFGLAGAALRRRRAAFA